MKEDNNVLKEAVDQIRHAWLHRTGNEVHAAIQDTIEALYGEGLKPLIVKKSKKGNRWSFIINLPPGLCYSEFRRKQEYFEDSTGGAVQMEKRGKAILMQVLTEELKRFYPYQWDYEEYEKIHLPFPCGYSAAGLIVKDLSAAPNMLVAGHPGAGKSNFLHNVAVSLLLARQIYLVVIDLKKLEFSYLKQSALVVSDTNSAKGVLEGINEEIDKRLDILEAANVVKVQEYHGEMSFVVLIIDELAELQDEDCQELLNRIVRLGRAAGICVVAATQRPSSTMFNKFGDSKAMFAASVCFHVRDEVNSRMVLDNDKAAHIPNIPGRAILQWDDEIEMQSMVLPIKQARGLVANTRQVKWLEQPQKRLPAR